MSYPPDNISEYLENIAHDYLEELEAIDDEVIEDLYE